MERKHRFGKVLMWLGGILLAINAYGLVLAKYWVLFGIDCLFFLALIVYGLAVYFSE